MNGTQGTFDSAGPASTGTRGKSWPGEHRDEGAAGSAGEGSSVESTV